MINFCIYILYLLTSCNLALKYYTSNVFERCVFVEALISIKLLPNKGGGRPCGAGRRWAGVLSLPQLIPPFQAGMYFSSEGYIFINKLMSLTEESVHLNIKNLTALIVYIYCARYIDLFIQKKFQTHARHRTKLFRQTLQIQAQMFLFREEDIIFYAFSFFVLCQSVTIQARHVSLTPTYAPTPTLTHAP